ncbi:hypothetical protein [Mesorhizobium sp. INR15]|uniref:hypothetical protein n=1 Tax=Mesorhizobium sp. INR15 TaxID=2654248 RepID=UPI0018966B01|nr:hypothetical protein [Mesorhizobium sp. INR15]QPC91995.1 hypothetical protein GA829_16155 [Mesorhizobium sp. INR15]
MAKLTSNRLVSFAFRASTAMALTAAPYQLNLHHTVAGIGPVAAFAKGGDGGGGHDGGGHDGGGGESHGGSSGPGGNSGSGGGDDGAGDDHGADNDNHGREHVNGATGVKVEVDGNNVEVTHPDGTKEEVENGQFEMKDALGRTIIERPATDADIARLQAL